MTSPTIKAFFDENTNTVTYVVSDPETASAAIIDPVLDYDAASGRTDTRSADAVVDYTDWDRVEAFAREFSELARVTTRPEAT